jgi:hypothetical protein
MEFSFSLVKQYGSTVPNIQENTKIRRSASVIRTCGFIVQVVQLFALLGLYGPKDVKE